MATIENDMKTIQQVILALAAAGVITSTALADSSIQRIYIIHFSHTDIGFTDMPGVCRELQCRYLDIALDGVLATMAKPAGQRFHWTCESLVTVDDWWQAASAARRKEFLKALRSGQLDVAALPCNQAPFLDAVQWRTMMHWVPDDLWRQFKPAVALQSDAPRIPTSLR